MRCGVLGSECRVGEGEGRGVWWWEGRGDGEGDEEGDDEGCGDDGEACHGVGVDVE